MVKEKNNLMAYVREWDGVRDGDASLVLLLVHDIRWLFVDADTKAFEFVLDDFFVRQRLVDVEHNKDQMTCFGNGNDLSSASLAVLSTLDDSRQVEHLYSSSVVHDLSRNRRQGRKLIRGS